MQVQIFHPWTKEIKTISVESITEKYISIFWAGTYDIELRYGTIRARSAKVRRKNPHCLWVLLNLDEVRKAVFEHCNPGITQKTDNAFKRHIESMPYQKVPGNK